MKLASIFALLFLIPAFGQTVPTAVPLDHCGPDGGSHQNIWGLAAESAAIASRVPFDQILGNFCGGDAYAAICDNAQVLSPGYQAALAELKAAALKEAGPAPTTGDHDFGRDIARYPNTVEDGVFHAQPLSSVWGVGSSVRTFEDNLEDSTIDKYMEYARQGVLTSISMGNSSNQEDLKKQVHGFYVRHGSVQSMFIANKEKNDFKTAGADFANTEEYFEGMKICGKDGLESNAYNEDGRLTLCPGAWAAAFATFREGKAPIPIDLIRLGVLGKMAHEVSHSIDPSHRPHSDYEAYAACSVARNPVAKDKDALKELFADHFGADVLGRKLTDYEQAGPAIPVQRKLQILLANYRELCTKTEPALVPELRARFSEIAGNPYMRAGLGCTPVKSPANYCTP